MVLRRAAVSDSSTFTRTQSFRSLTMPVWFWFLTLIHSLMWISRLGIWTCLLGTGRGLRGSCLPGPNCAMRRAPVATCHVTAGPWSGKTQIVSFTPRAWGMRKVKRSEKRGTIARSKANQGLLRASRDSKWCEDDFKLGTLDTWQMSKEASSELPFSDWRQSLRKKEDDINTHSWGNLAQKETDH